MEGWKIALPFVLVVLLLASASAGTVTVSNITSPTSGNYWKNGTHNIVFKVYASDVNGAAGQADLNVKIYYSTSAGAYTTLIDDYNLINTSYCGSVNDFNVTGGVQCTIPWSMSIATDGNYYVDFNAYTYRNGTETGDDGTGSSSSFYADNTAPSTVTSFVANDEKNGKIVLYWDKISSTGPTDFKQFDIYYSSTAFSDCSNGTLATSSTDSSLTTYTFTGLSTGVNYYFCVAVKDVAGNEDTTNAPIEVKMSAPKVLGGGYVAPISEQQASKGGTTSRVPVASIVSFLNKPITIAQHSFPLWLIIALAIVAYLIYQDQHKSRR